VSAVGRRLLGLVFVVALVAAMAASVLAYRKAFTASVPVTLVADRTGLELNQGADVKVRGVIVGEVRDITADGAGASLRLELQPAAAGQIPDNAVARLLPRTLFGEKYVELVAPAGASPTPIRAGAVVRQDRSAQAIELERILDDALPLLQAIAPDELATTLGALAAALDHRGERTGHDISTLDSLLTQLNRVMPDIAEDVRRLAEVADTYDGAAEDLLALLRDATVTATTVTDQRAQLAGFLADATDLADTTRTFLDRNGDRLIRLGQVSRPVLDLLAAYSPEYPCLLRGVVALQPQAEKVFADGRMHITLEITKDNGKYVAGRDDPVYGAHSGPSCRGLPDPRVPAPEVRVGDGYGGGGVSLNAPMGYAGTAEESAVVKPLVAAVTGARADQVPDVAVLLWGPLLRGTVVSAL
jgi:phospholipid/cholesterol/gamma-HCH transport system substrate-binding protein